LLSAVGPTITRLGLACDRESAPADQTVDPLALALCPRLEVLELTNHRLAGHDGDWTGIEHRRLSEIHYRLDGARPFALAPAISVARSPATNPPVVDSLALAEIGTLLRSPKRLATAFPALRTLSIGRLPSATAVARSGPHVQSQLLWLASLPRQAAEAGVKQVVEVTDEWHRPLGAVLASRERPFIGRSLELEHLPAGDVPSHATTAGPRRSMRLASKGKGAQAGAGLQVSSRAVTASPSSSIEAITPGSSSGDSGANGQRGLPTSVGRKSFVQSAFPLPSRLVLPCR
jgi:hypothetical protein